jgi:hypothetical protein
MPKMAAMHVCLNIDLFPKVWEMRFAAKSMRMKPTVPKMAPKYGTMDRMSSTEPTAPSTLTQARGLPEALLEGLLTLSGLGVVEPVDVE